MNHHYSILIQWSDEDQKYVVSFPEFGPYVHTHGERKLCRSSKKWRRSIRTFNGRISVTRKITSTAFNLPLGVKVPCFYKQRVLRRGKIPVAKRNSKF
ncbi:type II toxin-antitoxin system HicB family antitoxin [Aphanizomenon sp. UHCC 0183]|uniref:type II toxin-antitoxin system HicB family antitoxin n=1 Tax=Aphanizomenon sp. UHCC 0183 TaxID=2590028 RepID=UPI00352BB719